MIIRKSRENDIETMQKLYAKARKFMADNGNPDQWSGGYPGNELLLEDISRGESYVCEKDGEIVATFCFFQRPDPTYLKIYDGNWIKEGPYGVIHRITSSVPGAGTYCINHCFSRCKNLRIDTHEKNVVMQNLLKKLGFSYCGIIFLENGEERLAFQKV